MAYKVEGGYYYVNANNEQKNNIITEAMTVTLSAWSKNLNEEWVKIEGDFARNPYENSLELIERAFEPIQERVERYRTGEIYNDKYISRCREYALKADKYDEFLRAPALRDLTKCVPLHKRGYVFDGIANFD